VTARVLNGNAVRNQISAELEPEIAELRPERFELPTFWSAASYSQNPHGLFGVAYEPRNAFPCRTMSASIGRLRSQCHSRCETAGELRYSRSLLHKTLANGGSCGIAIPAE